MEFFTLDRGTSVEAKSPSRSTTSMRRSPKSPLSSPPPPPMLNSHAIAMGSPRLAPLSPSKRVQSPTAVAGATMFRWGGGGEGGDEAHDPSGGGEHGENRTRFVEAIKARFGHGGSVSGFRTPGGQQARTPDREKHHYEMSENTAHSPTYTIVQSSSPKKARTESSSSSSSAGGGALPQIKTPPATGASSSASTLWSGIGQALSPARRGTKVDAGNKSSFTITQQTPQTAQGSPGQRKRSQDATMETLSAKSSPFCFSGSCVGKAWQSKTAKSSSTPSSVTPVARKGSTGSAPSFCSSLGSETSSFQRASSLPLCSPSSLRPLDPATMAKSLEAAATDTEKAGRQSGPLVLDIRPYSAYATSRLPGAVSVCVPSTLLKRPTYSLDKLAEVATLVGANGRDAPRAKDRILEYAQASCIVIYDTQSGGPMAAVNTRGVREGTPSWHIANKFRQAGFAEEIYFLQDGFELFAEQHPALIDLSTGQIESDAEACAIKIQSSGLAGHLLNRPSSSHGSASLPGRLDRGSHAMKMDLSNLGPKTSLVAPALESSAKLAESPLHMPTRGHSALSRYSGSAAAANPFFDNIRQNTELRGGLGELIPVRLPPSVMTSSGILSRLPRSLRDAIDLEQGSRRLAEQFYYVEKDEQNRLQEVMMYHARNPAAGAKSIGDAKSSAHGTSHTSRAAPGLDEQGKALTHAGLTTPDTAYPFSICAAVEQGNKNRYNNIWPYEHTRVKLKVDQADDYFNASFIQMPGSTQRYVATQGPLPATFEDFWSVVWDQNVGVIVMLTKEEEGGRVKCHRYWAEGHQDEMVFGQLKLTSLEKKALDQDGRPCSYSYSNQECGRGSGGFFCDDTTSTSPRCIIARTFMLENLAQQALPPRKVVQLQYMGWPDYDIPDVPSDMLRLHALTHQAHQDLKHDRKIAIPTSEPTTTLVHCSAGVGRTGSFIVLETAIDLLERRIGAEALGKEFKRHDLQSIGQGGSETPATDLTRRFDTLASTDDDGDHSGSPEDDPFLILKILREIRQQRMSLVQTLRQYVFTHEALIAYLVAQRSS